MINFIKSLLKTGFRYRGTVLVSAYMALLMISSLLITLVEPKDSGLAHLDQALWWSVVTSTTVGYGDLFPTTIAGKLIAAALPMFMGIGLGAAFITHVASCLIERRDLKMHGEKSYRGSDHILLVGYTEETDYLIEQILGDETYRSRDIVLLADLPRHPMPTVEHLHFVKGRPDTIQALKDASIGEAARIVIHTGSDEKSLFVLLNALKLKSPDCEITVRCISSGSLPTFEAVPGSFETIMQMTAEMMVQAMQDKVHIPLQTLLKNDEGEEIYYVIVPDVPGDLTWWTLHTYLKRRFNYLSFAMKRPCGSIHINPPEDMAVTQGSGIWLIATDRPTHLTWPRGEETA